MLAFFKYQKYNYILRLSFGMNYGGYFLLKIYGMIFIPVIFNNCKHFREGMDDIITH